MWETEYSTQNSYYLAQVWPVIPLSVGGGRAGGGNNYIVGFV